MATIFSMQKFDLSRIDMHALRIFIAVHETGSISRAADLFDLNQSTISHTIEKLRRATGDQLFVRAGREIRPTQYADRTVTRAREIVALMEGLVAEDGITPDPRETPVTIACNVLQFIPELIALRQSLEEDIQRIRLKFLNIGTRVNAISMLEKSQAELVISAKLPNYPVTVNHRALFETEPLIFYDSSQRDAVRTVEDYAQARHAVIDFGGNRKSIVADALDNQSLTRQVHLSVPNAYVLGRLIKGTDLITTLPRMLEKHAFYDLSSCRPPMHLSMVRFDAIWHRRNEHAARNIWLREKVFDALRNLSSQETATAG